MDWAAAQETIRRVVAKAAGVQDPLVTWANTPERSGWCDPGAATVALAVRRLETLIGEERRVTVTGAPAPARTASLVGNRRLQVQCRIEVADQRPGHDSVTIAARLRTLLKSRELARELRIDGLALAEILPTAHADYTDAHRRVVSVAIVELRLHAAENLLDTFDAADWIDRVGIDPATPINRSAFEVP